MGFSHRSVPASLRELLQPGRGPDDASLEAAPQQVTAAPSRRTAFKPKDRITGMIVGCAVGDALGMPVEGVETRLTLHALNRLGGIRDFLAPQPHVIRTLRRLRPGCWTDDTQLTLAVARAMTRAGGMSYDAIADAHIEAFETLELRGWDTTTKQACRRLAQGTPRQRSGKLGGSGNGVAMKISPVAAWSFMRKESREQLLNHCVAIGAMTHYDPRAVVGAYLIALQIRDALASPRRWEPAPERYSELIEEAAWAEAQLVQTLGASDDPISQNLREVEDGIGEAPLELAELCNGATSYVCNSVTYVTALLCSAPWEFEDGIIAAVNGGGDTDTNGSMVGAVLGAAYGVRKLPRRFVDKVEESEMIRDLGSRFADMLTV